MWFAACLKCILYCPVSLHSDVCVTHAPWSKCCVLKVLIYTAHNIVSSYVQQCTQTQAQCSSCILYVHCQSMLGYTDGTLSDTNTHICTGPTLAPLLCNHRVHCSTLPSVYTNWHWHWIWVYTGWHWLSVCTPSPWSKHCMQLGLGMDRWPMDPSNKGCDYYCPSYTHHLSG